MCPFTSLDNVTPETDIDYVLNYPKGDSVADGER